MVRLSISKIQPKTSLMVLHEPSPSKSFLIETGSCRVPHRQLPEGYDVLAACVSGPNLQSYPQRHPHKQQGLQQLEEMGHGWDKAQAGALTWIPSRPRGEGQKQKQLR